MTLSVSGILILIAQVVTAVHAYRQGKLLWIALIIFVPVLGVLIYFFAEMLPSLQAGRGFQRAGVQVADTLRPGRRLQALEEQLQEQDTLVVRQAYAEELLSVGRNDEAIDVLRGGLKGVFATDPQGLTVLARAYLQKDEFGQAQTLLDGILEDSPGFETDRVRLLRARALEGQGILDEAIAEYRSLVARGLSEEPRYYLAVALEKAGRDPEAREVLEQAQKYFQRSSGLYRRDNGVWLRQLKKHFADKAR
ncbi:hypothetical protein BH24DEI2_BH24DEI2_06470 [soil metagenome]